MREARLTILHGSQTGTATDVAKRIRKQAKLRHFTTVFLALNDFTLENLATTNLIVFVVSTTGQGEEPDNMKIFWRTLLRRRLPPDALKHVDFAVLGLGDSSYQLFNFTAKRLNKRLVRLGATAFHPLGLADDQHELGFDGVADPWVSSLFDKLLEKFPLPDGVDLLSQQGPPESTYSIELVDRVEDAAPEISQDIVGVDPVFDADRPFLVSVLLNERATAEDHFQVTCVDKVLMRKLEACCTGPKGGMKLFGFFWGMFSENASKKSKVEKSRKGHRSVDKSGRSAMRCGSISS